MSTAELVERKIYEMQVALDDLTSLAHNPAGADAIRRSDIETIERRMRHLRFDVMAPWQTAAE